MQSQGTGGLILHGRPGDNEEGQEMHHVAGQLARRAISTLRGIQ